MARRVRPPLRPEHDAQVMAFVERFARVVESQGSPWVTARVMAYLMVLEDEMISSADLVAAVGVSAGSISTATRHLIELGFVRRVQVPGDRSHYFVADDDMWGSFLSAEHQYIEHSRQLLADAASDLTARLGPRAAGRVRNGMRYMTWLQGKHRSMYEEWRRYRAEEEG